MLLEDMGTTRKKRLSNTEKTDIRQGLQCLAHMIAQQYIRQEKEKIIKVVKEETDGND